jgi:hypothetical protein
MSNTTNTPIPTSIFRDIILPLVSESVPLNCNFLFNIKYKIKKWIEQESESLPSTKGIQTVESKTVLNFTMMKGLELGKLKIFVFKK